MSNQLVTAEVVRAATFDRAPLGRRGCDEQQVHAFLEHLADGLATRDLEIERLATENQRLKHALREWHRQLVGYDAAELLAHAQQQIEEQIAQAERFSRERELEAMKLLDEAASEAAAQAERTAGPRSDEAWLHRQQTYAGALLQALESLASQVEATRQAFSFEVGKLAEIDLRELSPPPGDGDEPAD